MSFYGYDLGRYRQPYAAQAVKEIGGIASSAVLQGSEILKAKKALEENRVDNTKIIDTALSAAKQWPEEVFANAGYTKDEFVSRVASINPKADNKTVIQQLNNLITPLRSELGKYGANQRVETQVNEFRDYATTPSRENVTQQELERQREYELGGRAGPIRPEPRTPTSEEMRTRMTDLGPNIQKRVQPFVEQAQEREERGRRGYENEALDKARTQQEAYSLYREASPEYPPSEDFYEQASILPPTTRDIEEQNAKIRERVNKLSSNEKPLSLKDVKNDLGQVIDDQVAFIGKKNTNTNTIKALRKAISDLATPGALLSAKSKEELLGTEYSGVNDLDALKEALKKHIDMEGALEEQQEILKQEEKLLRENEKLSRREAASMVAKSNRVAQQREQQRLNPMADLDPSRIQPLEGGASSPVAAGASSGSLSAAFPGSARDARLQYREAGGNPANEDQFVEDQLQAWKNDGEQLY